MNKKFTFKLLALPMLFALGMTTVSCTDYQTDIDEQGTRIDAQDVNIKNQQDSIDAINAAARKAQAERDSLAKIIDSLKYEKIQGIVYVPEYNDGRITVLANGTPIALRYRVTPANLAPVVAADAANLKFQGETVLTRAASAASLAISSVAVTNAATGEITIAATPAGFSAATHDAFALYFKNDFNEVLTAYTQVFFPIPPSATTASISGPASGTTFAAGGSTTLSVDFDDDVVATGVTWVSSDPSVATVDANGVVTFVGQGTVTITAYSATEVDPIGNPVLLGSTTYTVEGGTAPLVDGGVDQDQAQ
mgnify:CR=1 FL=1